MSSVSSLVCRESQILFYLLSSVGIYTYTYAAERNENCVACSQIPKDLVFHENTRLSEVMEHLSTVYQMKGPGVTTTDKLGRNRTLYLPNVSSIEERTRPNLKKTLKGNRIHLCFGIGIRLKKTLRLVLSINS